MLVTSPSLLANQITGRSKIGYRDTTPLAQLGAEYVMFTVRSDSPIASGRDLAERLKANPGSLSFSIGTTMGSHNHIAVAQLAKAVGVDPKPLKVIAFSGSADGITALLGGHISVAASPGIGACGNTRPPASCACSRCRRSAGRAGRSRACRRGRSSATRSCPRTGAASSDRKACPKSRSTTGTACSRSSSRPPNGSRASAPSTWRTPTRTAARTLELMDAQYKAMAANLADLGLVK